jgi:hypothetical protein
MNHMAVRYQRIARVMSWLLAVALASLVMVTAEAAGWGEGTTLAVLGATLVVFVIGVEFALDSHKPQPRFRREPLDVSVAESESSPRARALAKEAARLGSDNLVLSNWATARLEVAQLEGGPMDVEKLALPLPAPRHQVDEFFAAAMKRSPAAADRLMHTYVRLLGNTYDCVVCSADLVMPAQKEPAFACPACRSHSWQLRELGRRLKAGPRVRGPRTPS